MNFDQITQIPPGAKVIYLDASSLKYLACEQRYAYSTIAGLRHTNPSDVLDCGSAIHKFAELYATGVEYVDALSQAISAYPRADKQAMIKVCAGRESIRIPPALMLNGKHAVEFYFEVPWRATVIDGVVYAIVICGTIDHLALDGQTIRIIDYKSTRKWKVEDIEKKYAYEVQLRFYPWVLKKFGAALLPIELYNIAYAGRMTAQVCAVQVSGNNPRWILLSPQSLTEHQYQVFDFEMESVLQQIVELRIRDPKRNGLLSNLCEWCDYAPLCHAQSESVKDIVQSESFAVKEYKPSNHGKITT
jgi:hypothetical protein